jgi:hypothetical protein
VQRWPLGRELNGEIDANLAIPIIPALLVPKTNKFIFLSFIKALFELPMRKRSYNNYRIFHWACPGRSIPRTELLILVPYTRSFQAWELTYRSKLYKLREVPWGAQSESPQLAWKRADRQGTENPAVVHTVKLDAPVYQI